MAETRDDEPNISTTLAQSDFTNSTLETERRTEMAEIRDDTLRALIRLIPPARALKEDLEKSIHLELYSGTGDMAVKSFQGLHASVARLTDDPYVEALSMSVPENATDKEKVSLALLAAGQLAAYLEGQTGLVGMGGESGDYILAPQDITISGPISGIMGDAIGKMLGAGVKGKEEEEEQEEKEEK
jgi:hypothetical protein